MLAPQIGGVPLAVALGWYNIGYNAYCVAEHLLAGKGDRVLAPAAALVATDLDLLLDPCGLDLGLWEWSRSGPYAAEVEGPNGSHGIPAFNFAGWIGLSYIYSRQQRLAECVETGTRALDLEPSNRSWVTLRQRSSPPGDSTRVAMQPRTPRGAS